MNSWDTTNETEIEYCRRVTQENEPQTYRLHIMEEGTDTVLSDDLWNWRMIPGAAVMVNDHRYFVRRITMHPWLDKVSVVWVESDKPKPPKS